MKDHDYLKTLFNFYTYLYTKYMSYNNVKGLMDLVNEPFPQNDDDFRDLLLFYNQALDLFAELRYQ